MLGNQNRKTVVRHIFQPLRPFLFHLKYHNILFNLIHYGSQEDLNIKSIIKRQLELKPSFGITEGIRNRKTV